VKLARELVGLSSPDPKPRRRRGQPGTFGRLRVVRFGREAYSELRRSHWPNREQTLRLTALVVGISILMAIVLGLADLGFARLIELIAS
jgi:preprotein translocase subunit SecE